MLDKRVINQLKIVFMYIQLFVLRVKSPPTLKEEKMISGDNWDIQKQPPGVFYNKGVLRNFIKFTGKHLCQSLILIKLQAEAYNFNKNENLAQLFPCEFCEIYKNTSLQNTGRLLLDIHKGPV